MNLQDHFSPPLSVRRHWHAFHNAWATYIASDLNSALPPGYFAEPNVQFGVEIDVAAFDETDAQPLATWQPPAPDVSFPVEFAGEIVEINLFSDEGGPVLAGAIELVSPANKDRAAHRQAFVSKCEALLHQGVGLVMVDVVTGRHANLHDEVLERILPECRQPLGGQLYAAAYRVVERMRRPNLDVWQTALAIGQNLPVLPLWLGGGLCVPVDLAASYARTCSEQRLAA
jgi:hypothetical protein